MRFCCAMYTSVLEELSSCVKRTVPQPKRRKIDTISCEAVGDSDLNFWHGFDGHCGTNNDITVIDNSLPFIDILTRHGQRPLRQGYVLNGTKRKWPLYYLTDGMYPEWSTFLRLYRPLSMIGNDTYRKGR